MKNFRTYQIALDFYHNCQLLKIKHRVLRDQFERAILSIVLNLAEGVGRETAKDRKKFYTIAMGSLRETQGLLQILKQNELYKQSDILAAHLHCLIQNPGGRT